MHITRSKRLVSSKNLFLILFEHNEYFTIKNFMQQNEGREEAK